jgi:hypothetical protein
MTGTNNLFISPQKLSYISLRLERPPACSASDHAREPDGIRIQLEQWIRIRKPDPDPGRAQNCQPKMN